MKLSSLIHFTKLSMDTAVDGNNNKCTISLQYMYMSCWDEVFCRFSFILLLSVELLLTLQNINERIKFLLNAILLELFIHSLALAIGDTLKGFDDFSLFLISNCNYFKSINQR